MDLLRLSTSVPEVPVRGELLTADLRVDNGDDNGGCGCCGGLCIFEVRICCKRERELENEFFFYQITCREIKSPNSFLTVFAKIPVLVRNFMSEIFGLMYLLLFVCVHLLQLRYVTESCRNTSITVQ